MMKIFIQLFIVIISIGCNDSISKSPQKYGSDDIYIDPLKGSDDSSGKGTSTFPYKTITYALTKEKNSTGMTLYLAGGTYDSASGETFPIELSQGINLYAYQENNLSVKIQGFGNFSPKDKEACLVLHGNNRLHNFSLSSERHLGVLSLTGTNSIFDITLYNNRTGLTLLGSSYVKVESTSIEENNNGIEVDNKATLKLIKSMIKNNDVGVLISHEGYIDSLSENTKIKHNKNCDFWSDGSRNLSLQGISWDDNVSDFTIQESCVNGHNIVNQGEGTLSYQDVPNISSQDRNTSLIFNVKNEIDILYPAYDESISMVEPNINFNHSLSNKYIMVTIWKELPQVRANELQNPKDIFWYWHTGMEGGVGRVAYENGAKAVDGEIQTTSFVVGAEPLKRGRAYYLAIWEWDEEGMNVISSSRVSVFNVK